MGVIVSMTKVKTLLLFTLLIVTIILLAFLSWRYLSLKEKHSLLINEYSRIKHELESLNRSYTTLLENYTRLHTDFKKLSKEYEILEEKYKSLLKNYTNLLSEYDFLAEKYSALMEDYQELLRAFNEPLSYEEIPTIEELTYWLTFEDNTDKIAYSYPNFICGDFAFMLALHAKLKHWDMGVVAIIGYDEQHKPFAHVFNAIICKEGLVYVEPQTDDVWWYKNHEEITGGKWYRYPGIGYIYVEEYIIILRYD